jgi:hypothetical protein
MDSNHSNSSDNDSIFSETTAMSERGGEQRPAPGGRGRTHEWHQSQEQDAPSDLISKLLKAFDEEHAMARQMQEQAKMM